MFESVNDSESPQVNQFKSVVPWVSDYGVAVGEIPHKGNLVIMNALHFLNESVLPYCPDPHTAILMATRESTVRYWDVHGESTRRTTHWRHLLAFETVPNPNRPIWTRCEGGLRTVGEDAGVDCVHMPRHCKLCSMRRKFDNSHSPVNATNNQMVTIISESQGWNRFSEHFKSLWIATPV